MNEDVKREHTVKVEAQGCCFQSSWCKFFFQTKDKSESSRSVTPQPEPAIEQQKVTK